MAEENQAPAREPTSREAFRARQAERLAQERGSQPEPEAPSPMADTQDADTAERQPEEVSLEESEDQPEGETNEGALTDDTEPVEDQPEDSGDWTAREAEWQEKLTKAEEARKSMETDYRRKTHKLSESVREVDSRAEEVEATAQYFANEAAAALKNFENAPWQQLRTDPEKFQEAQNAYMQAQRHYEQRQAELQRIQERRKEIAEKNQQYIAEHSKAVLRHQIPDWGNETYQKLRDFAEKTYDYPSEEFDKIVDWRPMKMLYDAMTANAVRAESSKVVENIGKKTGKRPVGRRATREQPRNAQGQYTAAREKAMQNPGDRGSFREMKARQLAMERERGRR